MGLAHPCSQAVQFLQPLLPPLPRSGRVEGVGLRHNGDHSVTEVCSNTATNIVLTAAAN